MAVVWIIRHFLFPFPRKNCVKFSFSVPSVTSIMSCPLWASALLNVCQYIMKNADFGVCFHEDGLGHSIPCTVRRNYKAQLTFHHFTLVISVHLKVERLIELRIFWSRKIWETLGRVLSMHLRLPFVELLLRNSDVHLTFDVYLIDILRAALSTGAKDKTIPYQRSKW